MARTRNARNVVVVSQSAPSCLVRGFAFFANHGRIRMARGAVVGLGDLCDGRTVTVKGHIDEECAVELRGTLEHLHKHALNVVQSVTVPRVVSCGILSAYKLRHCGIVVDKDVQEYYQTSNPTLHCVVQEYLPGMTAQSFLLNPDACERVARGNVMIEFGVTDWEHSTWPIDDLDDCRMLPGLNFGKSVYADATERDWTIFTTADLINSSYADDERFDPRAFVWTRFICDVLHTVPANDALDRFASLVLNTEATKVPAYHSPVEHVRISSDHVIATAIDELDRSAVVHSMGRKRRRVVVNAQLAALALVCRSVAAFATACAMDRVFHFDVRLLNCIVKLKE